MSEKETMEPVTTEWRYLEKQQLPEVATISGEMPTYLCSGVLLIKDKVGSYYVGFCDIDTEEKVWRFYCENTGREIQDVVEWAQIVGEEAF